MSLLDDAIWWHVYPLGAAGAPIRGDQAREAADPGERRLLRLVPWLDYAVELGCSGVLLGPIFESASHGYDTLDHMAIDRRLGSEEDFEAFMAACRERGLNVMLDGVFNHVAATHPRAEELALRLPDGGLACWEGHSELLTLDHSKPAVVDFVADIMLHWLRKGIAGWRLDVAYAVPPRFWAETIGRVRDEFPNALFLGEVIHGDYAQIVAERATLRDALDRLGEAQARGLGQIVHVQVGIEVQVDLAGRRLDLIAAPPAVFAGAAAKGGQAQVVATTHGLGAETRQIVGAGLGPDGGFTDAIGVGHDRSHRPALRQRRTWIRAWRPGRARRPSPRPR